MEVARDGAGCSKEVLEGLLRLAWPGKMASEQGGEVGLREGECSAESIDHELEPTGMPSQLAGELRVAQRRALRGGRARREEALLLFERQRGILCDALASWMIGGQVRELAQRIAFAAASAPRVRGDVGRGWG